MDPHAGRKERYKVFHLGMMPAKAWKAYSRQRPDDPDPLADHHLKEHGFSYALYGGVSSDGLDWKPLPEPLLAINSDTQNICEYDPALGRYVAYVRTWFYNRRGIGRVASDDFRRFTLPDEVIWPDATQAPYDTWYANAKTAMPGAPDYHVMFPMRWSLPTDHFEIHLATSPDNILWSLTPGGAVCKPGEPGSWDAGILTPCKTLVEWGPDRMGILVAGASVPHKYPRRPPLGGAAWAWWPRGRLIALACPLEGSFSLLPLTFTGRHVHLNHCTRTTGFIQVEATVDGKAIPGRSFDDCDPCSADALSQCVTWRGQSDLGHQDGQAVQLHFRMRTTHLYSVEFK